MVMNGAQNFNDIQARVGYLTGSQWLLDVLVK